MLGAPDGPLSGGAVRESEFPLSMSQNLENGFPFLLKAAGEGDNRYLLCAEL